MKVVDAFVRVRNFDDAFETARVMIQGNAVQWGLSEYRRISGIALLTNNSTMILDCVILLLHSGLTEKDVTPLMCSLLKKVFKSDVCDFAKLRFKSYHVALTETDMFKCLREWKLFMTLKDVKTTAVKYVYLFLNETRMKLICNASIDNEGDVALVVFLCLHLCEWKQIYWALRWMDQFLLNNPKRHFVVAFLLAEANKMRLGDTSELDRGMRLCNHCFAVGLKTKTTYGKCPHCLGFYFCSDECARQGLSKHANFLLCQKIKLFLS